MLRIDTIRSELRGIAGAVVIIAVTTLVVLALQHYFGIRRGATIYLLAVLLAAWHFGLLPAVLAAVAGVALSAYLFYSPDYTFWVADQLEVLDLGLFLVVALVASHLANSMRVQTEIARKRETETSALYAFSRRLAAAPTAADIYRAIEDHLAAHAQCRVMLFGADGSAECQAGGASMPEQVRAAIADIQGGSSVEATRER
jgi:two-component system, OmpR family, sensor histidine kinase KdpD